MIYADNFLYSDTTGLIIKAFFNVYNTLGHGFLEKVYEKSLIIELEKFGLNCQKQIPISVFYEGINVGNYCADIIVNDCVIIEVKSASCLCDEHEAQLTNYLRATGIEVGLLLNFGQEPQFKRKVFSNLFKVRGR